MKVCGSLFTALKAIGRDRRANVAVTFAVALIPIVGFVGVAIDYSMASRQRAKIQSALDEALLAGSIAGKEVLDAGSGASTAIAAAKAAASAFFAGNTSGFSSDLNLDFKMKGLTLTGSGTATTEVPTSLN